MITNGFILRQMPRHFPVLPDPPVIARCCYEANRLLLHFVHTRFHLQQVKQKTPDRKRRLMICNRHCGCVRGQFIQV